MRASWRQRRSPTSKSCFSEILAAGDREIETRDRRAVERRAVVPHEVTRDNTGRLAGASVTRIQQNRRSVRVDSELQSQKRRRPAVLRGKTDLRCLRRLTEQEQEKQPGNAQITHGGPSGVQALKAIRLPSSRRIYGLFIEAILRANEGIVTGGDKSLPESKALSGLCLF